MRVLVLLVLAAAAAADAREEAWAAFRAGEQGDKQAVPRLIEALEGGEPAARPWVLDALVRLDADVPAGALQQVYALHPDEVLVLLALHPAKKEEALLAVARGPKRSLHWVAACNLLVARKSKLVAAHLLEDLTLRLVVTVVDGEGFDGIGLGGGAGGMFRGRRRAPHGWPPHALYKISDRQEDGAVPVAPGRRTIFYTRKVVQPGEAYRPDTEPVEPSERRNGRRLQYLADLLSIDPSELGLMETRHVGIAWQGADSYLREAAEARERIEEAYRSVVGKLVEAELLRKEDAPQASRLKVEVTDRRSDRTVALPELGG